MRQGFTFSVLFVLLSGNLSKPIKICFYKMYLFLQNVKLSLDILILYERQLLSSNVSVFTWTLAGLQFKINNIQKLILYQ